MFIPAAAAGTFVILPQLIRAAPAPIATPTEDVAAPPQLHVRDPAPSPAVTTLPAIDGITGSPLSDAVQALDAIVDGVGTDAQEFSQALTAFAAVITAQISTKVAPSAVPEAISVVSQVLQPTGISDAVSELLAPIDSALGPNGKYAQVNKGEAGLPAAPAGAVQSGRPNIVDVAVEFVANGIQPLQEANTLVAEQLEGSINSFTNNNPRNPKGPVYPLKAWGDAPYDISESQLRSAIHIPNGFTYGQKPPVILVPGTGSDGGDNFAGNMIPLLANVDFADPVWLNIPGFMLDDIQNNAEYIAYAINYISGVCQNKHVNLITWSQGGLASQWAFKYWPSTRQVVSDLVAVSPDYHGTTTVYFVDPGFPYVPSVPSFLQQAANSKFVATLLAGGGDKPYVPTTNVYSSIFDEIVEPQTGTQASAYLPGASNNEVQSLCPGLPAGSFYTHEGVLYNPLTFALVKDALTHDGPGQAGRLDLDNLCLQYATDGLDVESVLSTEFTIPQAVINFLLYFPKLLREPAIKLYAQ